MFPKNPKKIRQISIDFEISSKKHQLKKKFFIKKMQKIRSIIWIAIDIS